MPEVSLLDILNKGSVLIQLSSYVYASRLLRLAEQGYQFIIITTNPALRRLFENNGVLVIFIDVQEPRLRELINPLVVRHFRQHTRVLALGLELERFTSVILTINCIDMPMLEIISNGPPRSCHFYFLPESRSNNVKKCNLFGTSQDEILQILKRKILYRMRSYLGRCAGGRHAYVDLERLIPGIRDATLPPQTGDLVVSNRDPRCLFLASCSYREDERYFGNADFANVLRALTNLTPVQYKIHPGASSLRSNEFDDLGMEPLLSEDPIENLVAPGDLVVGNDSTALPRISLQGIMVVSISHMSGLIQWREYYGAEKNRYLHELQEECSGAIFVPNNVGELENLVRSWKSKATCGTPTLCASSVLSLHGEMKETI